MKKFLNDALDALTPAFILKREAIEDSKTNIDKGYDWAMIAYTRRGESLNTIKESLLPQFSGDNLFDSKEREINEGVLEAIKYIELNIEGIILDVGSS